MSQNQKTTGGIGFAGLLTIVLIVLKICNVGIMASASWVWCFVPLVVVPALVLTIVALFGMAALILAAIDSARGN